MFLVAVVVGFVAALAVWVSPAVGGTVAAAHACEDLGRRSSSLVAAPQQTTGLGYRGELHIGHLIHLRARTYDPVGAFTSVDPIDGFDGDTTVSNPYHYAGNDPVNHADPEGLCRMVDGAFAIEANITACEDALANATYDAGCQWGESGTSFYTWDPWSTIDWLDKGECTVETHNGAYGERGCYGRGWAAGLQEWSCKAGPIIADGAEFTLEILPGRDCYDAVT